MLVFMWSVKDERIFESDPLQLEVLTPHNNNHHHYSKLVSHHREKSPIFFLISNDVISRKKKEGQLHLITQLTIPSHRLKYK